MKPRTKRQIEIAVNKATRAIGTLTKVFEEHGYDIDAEVSAKTFGHLHRTLSKAAERADAARLTMTAPPVEAFSLDEVMINGVIPAEKLTFETPAKAATYMKEPQEPAEPTPSLRVVDVPPPAPKPKWVKPIGRLAGTKEPIYPADERPTPLDLTELDANPDKTGFVKDAGFLDK